MVQDSVRVWYVWRLRVQLDPFGNNANSRAISCSSQKDEQLKLGDRDSSLIRFTSLHGSTLPSFISLVLIYQLMSIRRADHNVIRQPLSCRWPRLLCSDQGKIHFPEWHRKKELEVSVHPSFPPHRATCKDERASLIYPP
jgi:hypothetical protein